MKRKRGRKRERERERGRGREREREEFVGMGMINMLKGSKNRFHGRYDLIRADLSTLALICDKII